MATKKDYETIANVIKESHPLTIRKVIHSGVYSNLIVIDKDKLVESLSDYFERNNPSFDRDRFLKACYKPLEK